jgi:arylsulfatase A-like enzyme
MSLPAKFLLITGCFAASTAHGQIHIAFHNGGTTLPAMTTRPAGTVVKTAADTWNNVVNNTGVGLAFSGFVLRDHAGTDTGARLASSAGFSTFNSNGWGSLTQDAVMMEGWYGIRAGESLTVTDLPAGYADGFRVIVYGDSDADNRTMRYTIGGQTRTIQDNGRFSSTFTDGATFTTFEGLSGSSFTLTGNPGAADARSAVNGMIIIPANPITLPVIQRFAANRAYLEPGGTAILSWNVDGADAISISPGPGAVSGASGSVEVTVPETTTFTLTATHADGERSATVRVAAGPPRPNIVFFLVDDMGWQDTSVPFYHDSRGNPVVTPLNQRYRTPAMESLAARGMKFTRAYSMSVCSPSRVSWMTGLNSSRHHVTNWTNVVNVDNSENSTTSHRSPAAWRTDGLPQALTTLPALLRDAGYRTIHAGKAHFGNSAYAKDPRNTGFDINIAGSEIGHPGSYSGNFGQATSRPVQGLTAYHNTGTHLSEAITLEMNKAIGQSVIEGAPFFAYLAHYAVHSPFETDPRFAANYPGLTGTQLGYATLIEGMDKSLGDLLARLEQLGVAENTLIIFTSDNGGDAPMASVNDSNTPLRHKKGSKYEGGNRVPMIAAWAKRNPASPFQTALPIPEASREDDLVAIFDIHSTLAAVAGVAPSPGIDGHDLSPYLRAEPGSHRPQELLIHYPHDHRSDYFSVFHEGDWKLIYDYPTASVELYHLASDLSESNNRAAADPVRVMRMARKLARALAADGAHWPRFTSNNAEDPFRMPDLPTVDSDGDGIPDLVEDANRNGLVDPGETDPDNPDTDGDGTSDGVELKSGTNPLDATSYFKAVFELEPGEVVLRWPSAPGAVYRVEASDALSQGTWQTVSDNIPASPLSHTSLQVPDLPAGDRRFFRVVLK